MKLYVIVGSDLKQEMEPSVGVSLSSEYRLQLASDISAPESERRRDLRASFLRVEL